LTLCHLNQFFNDDDDDDSHACLEVQVDGYDVEILTWAQRKTIIQTQFVSVVSKVISDGIFNERFQIKNKKTLAK